jgi:hypothetical protein
MMRSRPLYHSREKNNRYRNRNAPKLEKNSNNCDANIVVAQANGIFGVRRRIRRFRKLTMPIRQDTVLRKVEQMPNKVNSHLLKELYQHMKDNGTSQNYQKANLKAMIHFAERVGDGTSFFDIDHKQVARFLDTKIKSEQIDPDKKWITTWNDYLWRLKLFLGGFITRR